MANENKHIAALFPLCLDGASTVGTDPTFHLSLLVDPLRHSVTGVVEMRQHTPPPFVRFNVTGAYHELVFGAQTQYVITLQGQYFIPLLPPQIGEIVVQFSAVILLNGDLNGTGTFHYGRYVVEQAGITKVPCC